MPVWGWRYALLRRFQQMPVLARPCLLNSSPCSQFASGVMSHALHDLALQC
uniref:Uncharacterized protein n=1 Tax=Zea mays TaxID=4577 RepID=B6U3K2_MAIZE|nr:hypothetical protein [Zea mays]